MEMAWSIERPEPAFRAPELHGRPGEAEADLAWLEMHLARQPRDLAGHSRRVQLARHSGSREAVYGALVDLFIALAGHGVGLKSALLSQSALLLGPPERLCLARHLASGLRADQIIEPHPRRSVLSHGLIGKPSPELSGESP
ncbi:hypothetical protein [Zoogloea sp.]|uniref:hypothetical protein n=1 Tax=Zoogloea sp. TaxID=49181 RepID=UPI002616E6A0|nr:hypothetical protein [uncultured Zoogloea sp.]